MDEMDSSKRKLDEICDEDIFPSIFQLDKKMKSDFQHILDFSDCVLTLILSYLKTYDLYRLSKTCTRFRYLIKERKLWKKVTIDQPVCAKKFAFFFDNINNTTDTILLTGINRKEKAMTFKQFKNILNICENLSILAIENQYINSDEIRLSDFPQSLKELSLRGTHITGKQPFLQDAHKKLINLHTLILDDCKWFHEHSLMALSKLSSLENLSLFNCRNLNDSVAYMSVTARFGFHKLLRIDARCTSIGDQFLKCFHCIKTLREIYLESPPVSVAKRGSLFEEIKKWCTSNMQSVPNVVIFNQNTVNTVFKRNRHTKRTTKKSKSEDSPSKIQSFFDCNFNCVEECESCSVDTCSCFLQMDKLLDEEAKAGCSKDTQEPAPELMYSDDVSDSEDEMMNFEMFHSDVTDSGVQWFCSSDPESLDFLGSESTLFKKPFGACVCQSLVCNKPEDKSQPGPSGLNQPGSSKSPDPKPSHSKHHRSPDHSQDSKRRIVFKRKKYCDLLRENSPENRSQSRSKRRCTGKPSITVDLSLGEGPLHLEIINELGQNQRRLHSQESLSDDELNGAKRKKNVRVVSPKPKSDTEDGGNKPSTSKAVEVPNVAVQNEVRQLVNMIEPREQEGGRNRDLRVIIERLDPGLHIVIDRAGRIQFGPMRANNFTKLKVFMARGYKMITDHALRSLIDLRLEVLDVTGTSVTARGVQQFLMVNPDCKVIHESICYCG